jgi:hypothetical protein
VENQDSDPVFYRLSEEVDAIEAPKFTGGTMGWSGGISRFSIRRSEIVDGDISRYRQLREEAEKVGGSVEIID